MNRNGRSNPKDTDRWLSTGAAARVMEVSPDTIRRYADAGRIRSRKLPSGHRKVLVPEEWCNPAEGTRTPQK